MKESQMINAWDYAYDNYDGDNESSVVDSIVESIMEDIYDACDITDSVDSKVEEHLEEAIRDFVVEAIDFGEIKQQMEENREEYFERQRAMKGDY